MISIVEDLESIARLESGFFNLQYSHFNIVELFKETFENQELRAKEKGIQLKFKNTPEKPVYVYADREQIDHLITNLIVNSINYGVDYGYTEVSFLDMDENILIEVTDNGMGIPEQDIPRIFERFYRVDKSRSRNAGGTGLGLAIVKHIIEAHNQTINVRSSIKNGTSFAFTLKKGKKK
jgi:two-component system phosphate regulon sensor histidine kinase PhoR